MTTYTRSWENVGAETLTIKEACLQCFADTSFSVGKVDERTSYRTASLYCTRCAYSIYNVALPALPRDYGIQQGRIVRL